MLPVATLRLTQDGFRHSLHDVWAMMDYVQAGGKFDLESLQRHDPNRTPMLVAITEFEDGALYVRDGFHRVTSILLSRLERALYPNEYFVEHMTYNMFQEINLAVGFVTPFDPRTEVRLPDFQEYRRKVLSMDDPIPFILANRGLYSRSKKSYHETLESFIQHYLRANIQVSPLFSAHLDQVADIR